MASWSYFCGVLVIFLKVAFWSCLDMLRWRLGHVSVVSLGDVFGGVSVILVRRSCFGLAHVWVICRLCFRCVFALVGCFGGTSVLWRWFADILVASRLCNGCVSVSILARV